MVMPGRWAGPLTKVQLIVPRYMVGDFKAMLQDVVRLPAACIDTPAGAARAAAKHLAFEILCRPPWMRSEERDADLRMTVPKSEAMTLLAWLLSSTRTDDAASPLRLLIDGLYQLKG